MRSALRRVLTDEDVRSIARRYFVSNGFDGVLTGIGVVVGAYLSGVTDGFTVVKIGAGAAVGLSTSGVWSVWEIERAERRAERRRTEQAMLRDLEDTRIHRDERAARAVTATMSGIGPVIGTLVPVLPFLAVEGGLAPLSATLLAIAGGVALLFVFGAYMGSISGGVWYRAGVRMGAAGIVVALLNVVLPG